MIPKDSIEQLTAAVEAAQQERDEALKALKQIEEYGTKEINEAVTLRQECSRLKVVLRELLAIMPRATCENLPHDSLDAHPRSTHCWALQHFNDTVKVAKGLVYPPF